MLDLIQNGFLTGIIFPSQREALLAFIVSVVGLVLVSYLLGSINSAVFISKRFFGEDIRRKGSGNAGLTNMKRVYGTKAAVLVLAGDVFKTVLAVFLSFLVFGAQYTHGFSMSSFAYLAGFACILGHIYPIFCGFRGGKGVLCTAAMGLVLSPMLLGILLICFVLILWGTKYVSVASISVAILYPLTLNRILGLFSMHADGIMSLVTVLIAILIVWRHRSNIARIQEKTESKFYFKKQK